MNVESYMHLHAKRVLAGWLRSAAADHGYGEYVTWGPFNWRVNRGPDHYGVWEEYPITKDSLSFVWDEQTFQGDENAFARRCPTYDECGAMGGYPLAILDLAIQHKGFIPYGIEIVHKNDVSDRKLQKLQGVCRGTQVYRVPAHWIMGQVGIPSTFVGERIV